MTDGYEMGPEWEKVWEEKGLSIWQHRITRWLRLDARGLCSEHEDATCCVACFPKVDRMIAAARHVLAGKKPPGGENA